MDNRKRVIVDYKKVTSELLGMLVEKYPNGYNNEEVIHFKNTKGELIEALEVTTKTTKYLVKVSAKLAQSMADFDEEDETFLDTDALYELLDENLSSSEEE